MNSSPAIRKIFQGVASRQQMFRMFDRHAQRPNRWDGDATALYGGEWFETGEAEHDYMFELLPPLWIRGSMFAMREFLTGQMTSVFFALRIDGHPHGPRTRETRSAGDCGRTGKADPLYRLRRRRTGEWHVSPTGRSRLP